MSDTYQLKLKNGVKKGLKQRNLVNEVVLDYINSHPSSTLADLQQAFPARVQKKLEIVLDEASANKLNVDKNGKTRKQYHIFEGVRLPNGAAIAVCNQWGIGNIDSFLNHARQMGYQIGQDGEEMTCGVNNSKTMPQEKSAPSLDCYSGQNGQMAIIGDTLYFLHAEGDSINRLYSAPIKGKGKAKEVVDKQGLLSEPEAFNRICAWNEKLYFSFGSLKTGTKFGDCPGGFFSFDPATRNIELLIEEAKVGGSFEFSEIYEGKAYGLVLSYSHDFNFKLLSFDLKTNNINILPIPTVSSECWNKKDYSDYPLSENIHFSEWLMPTIRSGYAYTANRGFQTLTLRFPLDNPERYETLPCGVFYNIENEGCSLLATGGNVLLMPLAGSDTDFLCALEHDTLKPIKGFDWQNNPTDRLSTKWVQYDDLIAIDDKASDNSRIYKISEHKFLGNTGNSFYADVLDMIMTGDKVYAIKTDYDSSYKRISRLFAIPKKEYFLKGTNPSDYAVPLF